MFAAVVLGLTCLLFWGIAGNFLWKIRADTQLGTRVMGEVSGFGRYVSKGRSMYYAQYRAVLPDGREVSGQGTMAKSWKSPAVGTRVALYYRADDPENQLHEMGVGRFMLPGIFIVLGVMMAGIGMSIGAKEFPRSLKSDPALDVRRSTVAPSGSPAPTLQLTRANLASESFKGEEPLDVRDFAGSLVAFDAIANFAWAAKLGTAWSPDAILIDLRILGCDRAGIVDLARTPDAEVDYEFVSPARVKQLRDSTSIKAPEVNTELDLYVRKDGVFVSKRMRTSAGSVNGIGLALAPPCTLANAMAVLDKAKELPAVPIYKADLRFTGSEKKERWIIQGAAPGSADLSPIDGVTCKVSPW